MITTIAQAKAFREKIESAAKYLPVAAALNSPELFPKWDGSKAYNKGDRFTYNGTLYECIQVNPVNPTWTPDITYTYYRPVANAGEEGTVDNPITAAMGMEYEIGKYYREDNKIYLCERSGMTTGETIVLNYLPSSLVGNYFREVN